MRNLIYFLISILIINGCAKRGSPTGGPKDSIPPILVNANPKLNSTNFNEEEIRLTFDEWIKLDKVQDQLIISPPIDNSSYEIKPLTGVTKISILPGGLGNGVSLGFFGCVFFLFFCLLRFLILTLP